MSECSTRDDTEIEQAAQGVIVGYGSSSRTNPNSSRDHLTTVAVTMRKPSNWSQRQEKTPRKDSSV